MTLMWEMTLVAAAVLMVANPFGYGSRPVDLGACPILCMPRPDHEMVGSRPARVILGHMIYRYNPLMHGCWRRPPPRSPRTPLRVLCSIQLPPVSIPPLPSL